MSWITPKMTWRASDYYNLNDAQRIAGNICHLVSMADEIYSQYVYRSPDIVLLIARDRQKRTYKRDGGGTIETTITFYGRIENVVPSALSPHLPSEYNGDDYDWLLKDAENLIILVKLLGLSKKPYSIEPDYNNKWYIEYNIGSDLNYDHLYYQNRLSIVDDEKEGNFTFTDPLSSLWPEFRQNPIASAWVNNGSNRCDVQLLPDISKLANKPFWTYDTLNIIEGKINEVYNLYTSYLGG